MNDECQDCRENSLQCIWQTEWLDIKQSKPPRNKEILFLTGDGEIHLGGIFSEEKIERCPFHSYSRKCDYFYSLKEPLEDRVIYWHPIPEPPRVENEWFI